MIFSDKRGNKTAMESISQSINKLLVDTYGGIIIVFIIVARYSGDIFRWAGKKLAEGAINDFIKKLMPTVEEKLDQKFSLVERKIEERFEKIEQSLKPYKDEKHNLENDRKIMLRAILDEDKDTIAIIRSIYEKEQK